jgi:fructose-1,6-bisphosphatase/inositol monophosphatase family enzyme
MHNANLLEFMYGAASSTSNASRDMEPGEVISSTGYGDDKLDIDQVAEDAIVDYLEEAQSYDVDMALKPEDAEWGEDAWLTPEGDTLSGDELDEVDYALIVDQVEGTKNYDNRDRYTTLAAIDPENPTLEGTEASLAFRWDDNLFFSDGENAYQNSGRDLKNPETAIENSRILEADDMDEVNYDTKIRGQMIGLNARDYADLMENIVEKYELAENDWPSLKADGTTTGDILGAVTDNCIAVDVRALKDRKRLPFAQDFAPAAKIARDAGATVVNEKGEPIDTNFTEPGAATAYIALPPGHVSKEITEDPSKLLGNVV